MSLTTPRHFSLPGVELMKVRSLHLRITTHAADPIAQIVNRNKQHIHLPYSRRRIQVGHPAGPPIPAITIPSTGEPVRFKSFSSPSGH